MRYRFTLYNPTLGSFELPRNPIGWKDMSILIKRSQKYHGITFSEVINLEFLCGSGKEYLDSALALGVDTLVTVTMDSECAPGDGFEVEYTGRASLKTLSTINGKTTVDIIEDTIADTVLNRMDTPVNLSKLETLDGTVIPALSYGPYPMNLHSKVIVFQSELSSTEESVAAGSIGITDTLLKRTAVPIILPVNLTELPDIYQYSDFIRAETDFDASFPDTLYTAFEAGTYTIDYKIQGNFSVLYQDALFYFFRFGYRINDISDPYTLYTNGGATYTANVTQVFDFDLEDTLSLSLNAGDTVSFFGWFEGFDNFGEVDRPISISQTLDHSSYLRITKKTTTPDTTANVHAIFETGAGIFRSLANQADVFRSEYYGRKNSEPYAYSANGCGSFRAITNGALIRNFPIADRPVRITGNEFFDSLNAIDNLGLGIERIAGIDYVVMEPKSHFYSNTLLFQLSKVPDMKIAVAPEYYYNTFENGYAKWQIEQKGGLDEVNSIRKYDLGLKTIDNPLTVISTLIAGGYPIEIARRKQYPESFTEDADTDNDNFIICLNKSVDGGGIPDNLTTAEKDENYTQVNNVLDSETSYNLDLSPGRNTLRWSPVLNVGLLAYPARNIKFTYGEGNFKMTSQTTSSTCPGRWDNELFSEGEDIQWDDANNSDNTPLWIPLTNTFRFPMTRAQFSILKANPNGYIEVSEGTTDYVKWYILEAKYSPVGGMTEFKLLKKWQ